MSVTFSLTNSPGSVSSAWMSSQNLHVESNSSPARHETPPRYFYLLKELQQWFTLKGVCVCVCVFMIFQIPSLICFHSDNPGSAPIRVAVVGPLLVRTSSRRCRDS